MALLTAQTVGVTGLEATYAAASGGGDTVAPAANQILHVINGDATDHDVTIVRPGTSYGQANPDVTVTVTAGEERFITLPAEFASGDPRVISITYDGVTSVTVAVLRV